MFWTEDEVKDFIQAWEESAERLEIMTSVNVKKHITDELSRMGFSVSPYQGNNGIRVCSRQEDVTKEVIRRVIIPAMLKGIRLEETAATGSSFACVKLIW